jgi:cation diffusion facilitator CzcD-associated flavoprotein CzcO
MSAHNHTHKHTHKHAHNHAHNQDGTLPAVTQLDAVIIGAGFAGMYQLLCLRDRLGLKVRVLEAAGGVGGTWYWNRYPGARCDSESHSYMYYFDPELVRDWEWSERYPQQPEILRYLNHVADRYRLRADIQFDTRVTAAHYDAEGACWEVVTEAGERFRAPWLITAVGCLSTANVPQIEGLSDFQGHWYHTGQWPHEGVDFRGKRVGVVGTGSTGIQAIPVIAQTARHLTVFQRTANYSIPARNAPLSVEQRQRFKDEADQIRLVMNTNTNAHPFRIDDRRAIDTPVQQRTELYEKAWQTGGLRFRAIFKDLLVDEAANRTAADFICKKIREIVKDPGTARILSDIDHPFAAKRPPIDSGYFETFNRDHVDLVDLRTTPIERITAHGIRAGGRDYGLDIIVFATGFDAMTGSFLKMDIRGRDGVSLKDAWHGGPVNYLGLSVPGFPNLFTLTGPGSPSVLCNLPPAIEQHVNWVTECIAQLRQRGAHSIEPTMQAAQAWCAEVNEAADATLLSKVPHSWYTGANVPGKPRVFMPYAGGFARYQERVTEITQAGYAGFTIA